MSSSDPYLSLVPIRNNLGTDIKKNEVKKKIIERINELGLLHVTYKNNQELLLLVCNLVEYLIVKKDNISKKELVLDILNTLYVIQQNERTTIEQNIEFLHQSKMIKTVSRWKLFCTGLKEIFWTKKK